MALRHPKPTPEQNAGRLIRRAAQVLEDRAWIQGGIGDGTRGMCVRGAISFTAHGNANVLEIGHDSYRAEVYLSRWLLKLDAIPGIIDLERSKEQWCSFVPAWNDADGRTKEEVIQYMRKFADEVDPQLK